MRKSASILATAVIIASGLFGAPAANAVDNTITAGGSSFAGGIITACATNYAGTNIATGVVNYDSSAGSSSGKSRFTSGQYDFGATDFVYTGVGGDNAPAGTKYVAVTSGPIAIAYNLKVNNVAVTGLRITPELLAKIYKGQITTWNNSQILAVQTTAVKAKLNALTSKNITPVYRTAGSGTSYNFSGYLAATTSNFVKSADWAVATESNLTGSSATSSSNLKSIVDTTSNSIGYLDLKDASGMTNGQIAYLRNQNNQYYQPTVVRTSAFLKAHSAADINADGSFDIHWTKVVDGGYNASLITYAVVKTTGASTGTKGANLRNFLKYVLYTCGPSISAARGYTFIADPLRAKGYDFVKLIK
jgi:phosphate transport system substrate-binding protein